MRKSLLSLTRETLSPVAPPSTVGGMDAKSTASNAMGGYFIRQSVRQECAADTSATSCAPVRHSIVPREMFLPPMLGDVAPGAKPHSVAPACIFEKLDQPSRPGGTPDETIMKIDRHHLGVFGAFLVEQVETVHHVTRESVRGAESENCCRSGCRWSRRSSESRGGFAGRT